MSVQCKPVQCETQDQPLQCGQPGFVNLTRPQADNPCCPETLCGECLLGRGGGGTEQSQHLSMDTRGLCPGWPWGLGGRSEGQAGWAAP